MNFPLFKMTFRNNWFLLAIFSAIMLGYLMMILSMYNPATMEMIENSLEALPEGLAAAVGMDKIPLDITDFAANYFYGFLVQLFLLVHVILLPLRLVVKEVDNGSMAFLLSTRTSRFQVILTKALYMTLSLFTMMFSITLVSILSFGGEGGLDGGAFIQLNFTTFLLATAMASIVFFFSCNADVSIRAILPGAGILLLFFIMSLVARYGHFRDFYAVLGRLSIFSLLEARQIIYGEVNMLLNNGVLLLLIIGFQGAGILRFSRRDLPL